MDRKTTLKLPEIAKFLVENQLLSGKEKWSRSVTSFQLLPWHDCRWNPICCGRRIGHLFKHQKNFLCTGLQLYDDNRQLS